MFSSFYYYSKFFLFFFPLYYFFIVSDNGWRAVVSNTKMKDDFEISFDFVIGADGKKNSLGKLYEYYLQNTTCKTNHANV